jgi:phosphatidylglycerol:prolipoprotein diacylglycerol transferase
MVDLGAFDPARCLMLTYPEIDPVIFSIGPVAIRWYGLMYVIGFIGGWFLARRRCTRPDSPVTPDQLDDLVFMVMIGVIVGGRVGYCLVYGLDELVSDPLYLFKITEGGMSFHGGLAGVMLAMWWFGRKRGKTMWQITDFIAPFVPIGLGAGRIGNFINGELWGKPTSVPWGFNVNGQVLHPTQLYEALLEGLVLFVVLYAFSSRPRPYMAVSGLFLLLYGVFRFFVEFYRVPDKHMGDQGYIAFDWLTTGQLLSLPMIAGGLILLFLAYRRRTEAPA